MKRKLSPFKRKVHINQEEWSYQIRKSKLGSSGYLRVCNPSQTKKFQIKLDIVGKSGLLDDFESCPEEFDGEWDEIYSQPITPSFVKEVIIKNIVKWR